MFFFLSRVIKKRGKGMRNITHEEIYACAGLYSFWSFLFSCFDFLSFLHLALHGCSHIGSLSGLVWFDFGMESIFIFFLLYFSRLPVPSASSFYEALVPLLCTYILQRQSPTLHTYIDCIWNNAVNLFPLITCNLTLASNPR